MQLACFSIPARGDSGSQEELNSFLRSHRVLTVHREFVAQGDNSFWALSVEYMEGAPPSAEAPQRNNRERVDYKETLSPGDFALFARLRDWRKTVAEKEGVAVYAVLTNGQLAAVAAKRPSAVAALREVEGIGESRAGKYGGAVLEIVAASVPSAKVTDGTTAASPAETP